MQQLAMKRLIVFVILGLGLVACQPTTQSEVVSDVEAYYNAAIPDDISAEMCRNLGGEPAGIAGQTCSFPTPDAGNACLNHSECVGACLANEVGDRVGFCSARTATYGCLVPFDNGQTQPPICID